MKCSDMKSYIIGAMDTQVLKCHLLLENTEPAPGTNLPQGRCEKRSITQSRGALFTRMDPLLPLSLDFILQRD